MVTLYGDSDFSKLVNFCPVKTFSLISTSGLWKGVPFEKKSKFWLTFTGKPCLKGVLSLWHGMLTQISGLYSVIKHITLNQLLLKSLLRKDYFSRVYSSTADILYFNGYYFNCSYEKLLKGFWKILKKSLPYILWKYIQVLINKMFGQLR